MLKWYIQKNVKMIAKYDVFKKNKNDGWCL